MMTEITCPHCGHIETMDVVYRPNRVLQGQEFQVRQKNEDWPLRQEGHDTCPKCKRVYSYKYRVQVVCDTAAYPFEGDTP